MGKYVTLQGGKDWLEGEAVLKADRVILAEDEADKKIDREFHPWKTARLSWITPAATPKQINRIAKQYASAEYHRVNFMKGNPDGGMPQAAKDLFEQAEAAIDQVKSVGYIVGDDDKPIYPDSIGAQGMFPAVER